MRTPLMTALCSGCDCLGRQIWPNPDANSQPLMTSQRAGDTARPVVPCRRASLFDLERA